MGINSIVELENAKALQTGRLAMGSAVVFMATQAWMSGRLTGNGPSDRQKRQGWIDGGYLPRTIDVGGVRVGYDSIEPFNLVLSTIADVGDASMLMGEEWTERELQKISLVVAQAVSSKSYLAGIQQLVDLAAGRPGQVERITASLMNNTVPLAGLRNEIGKLINPHMREINSGIFQSLRNRNLSSEFLPGRDLPVKYDMLNGNPIRDYDFMTRSFNMFSPVSLNLEESDARRFLFDSGYDLRMSIYYAPDGTNLTDEPNIRSMFQREIGNQNLEYELDKLRRDPKIIASMQLMYSDIKAGRRSEFDARDYYHNRMIDRIFKKARVLAWRKLTDHPEITSIISEQRIKKEAQIQKQFASANILNIYK